MVGIDYSGQEVLLKNTHMPTSVKEIAFALCVSGQTASSPLTIVLQNRTSKVIPKICFYKQIDEVSVLSFASKVSNLTACIPQ